MELFGFTVKGNIVTGGNTLKDCGELVLTPSLPGIPLTLRWSAAELEESRLVSLQIPDSISAEDPWLTFMEWVSLNRRVLLGCRSAFQGLTRGILTVYPNLARLECGGVFDSFARPSYNFIYPKDLFADYDLTTLPPDLSLEIYRNPYIKQRLCAHVFDTDKFELFLMSFIIPDAAQHLPWNSSDPLDHEVSFKNRIALGHWKEIDRFLGAVLDILGPEWVMVMASDHGFDRVDNRRGITIDWNGILAELGLLEFKPTPELKPQNLLYQPPRDYSYRVTITCSCLQPSTMNASGSLIIVDNQGKIVSDILWFPGNGAYPPGRWRPGTWITSTTEIALEEKVNPGNYELILTTQYPYSPGVPIFALGTIAVPDSPPSLIKPEALMRIGDVQVLTSPPESVQQRQFEFRPGINVVSWTITKVANRALDYVGSYQQKLVPETSVCAYLAANDLEGRFLDRDGIYLLDPKLSNAPQLLYDVAELIRSIKIGAAKACPFSDVIAELDKGRVVWTTDLEVFGPEIDVAPLAFRTYNAEATLSYTFRGREYNRLLRETLASESVGSHATEGMYVISGKSVPDIGPGADAFEWDIAPTLLEYLGLPGKDLMDGKPIIPRSKSRLSEDSITNDKNTETMYEALRAIGYVQGLTH